MLDQNIDGYDIHIVEFDTEPTLPIIWADDEAMPGPHAAALSFAIRDKIITKPGKYGVHILTDNRPDLYTIFEII